MGIMKNELKTTGFSGLVERETYSRTRNFSAKADALAIELLPLVEEDSNLQRNQQIYSLSLLAAWEFTKITTFLARFTFTIVSRGQDSELTTRCLQNSCSGQRANPY